MLARIGLAAHLITALLVAALLQSFAGCVLALLVLILGLLRVRRLRTSSSRVQAIRYDDQGWSVRQADQWRAAHLLSPVFVHRNLLILRLRVAGSRWPSSVAVTHDSCSDDAFRRLRVVARHLPAPALWASSR